MTSKLQFESHACEPMVYGSKRTASEFSTFALVALDEVDSGFEDDPPCCWQAHSMIAEPQAATNAKFRLNFIARIIVSFLAL